MIPSSNYDKIEVEIDLINDCNCQQNRRTEQKDSMTASINMSKLIKLAKKKKYEDNESTKTHRLSLLSFLLLFTIICLVSIFFIFSVEHINNQLKSIISSDRSVRTVSITDVPLPQIVFYIFCYGAVCDFAIRSSGAAHHELDQTAINQYKKSNYVIFILCALTIVTVSLIPPTYQLPPNHVHLLYSRGNCTNPSDISNEFYTICPTFKVNQSFVHVNNELLGRHSNTYGGDSKGGETFSHIKTLVDLGKLFQVVP
jgi:hypothetical protein